MNIQYKRLNILDTDQLIELIKLFEDVFKMQYFTMPDRRYLQNLLANENIIFYVARSENILLGGLTAYFLPSTYYSSSEVYIYDLAVNDSYQRKGIGSQLITSLKEYCKSLGISIIYVQADLEDQHAIDFYKSTGGIAKNVVHFSYTINGE